MRSLDVMLQEANTATIEADIDRIERLIELGNLLNLGLSLAAAQELYFQGLYSQVVPICLGWLQRQAAESLTQVAENGSAPSLALLRVETEICWELPQIRRLLELGQLLAVDVTGWLNLLP